MEISTKRMLLRELRAGDQAAVHAFAADPAVCAFSAWGPNTVEETANFLAQCRAERAMVPRDTWSLAITLGGEVIGTVALMTADSDLVHGPSEAEIGYVLRADTWGNGYAAEAAQAVLMWAHQTLRITRAVATCGPENAGSVRVLEKIGMQQIDYLHGHKYINGEARDSVLFARRFPGGGSTSARQDATAGNAGAAGGIPSKQGRIAGGGSACRYRA